MSVYKQSSVASHAVCETIQWHCPSLPIRLDWGITKGVCPTRFHYHATALEVHIIQRGNSRFIIDRRLFPFQSYTALVIQPIHVHRYFHEHGQQLQQVRLMVDQSLLAVRQASLVAKALPELIKLSSEELNTIEMQCRLLEREINHASAVSLTMVQNDLENIILLLQRAGARKTAYPVSDSRIMRIIDFIETNYAQKLNIEQLAATVAMSPSYLSHRFKQQTLISIKQYILQCRIAAAKACLESADNVKMIVLAEQLGFSDLPLFSNCFKHYMGMSPGAYRRILSRAGSKPAS